MDLIDYLLNKFGPKIALSALKAKSPLAIRILDALAPSIPALCDILKDEGITTFGGIDVAEFVEALSKEEREGKS